MSAAIRLAVITTVAGRRRHLERQQQWLAADGVGHLRVIVAMDDDPVDAPGAIVLRRQRSATGALPLAEARNAGAAAALDAGATLLVFLDVDCLPRPGLLAAYRRASAGHPGALLSGAVTYLPEGVDYDRPDAFDAVGTVHGFRPRPAPGGVEEARHDLFWSLSFACTAEVWVRIGGFDEGYTGYGAEDTDFGSSAREAGLPLLFIGGAEADHQYHPVSDPPVEHLDDIVQNATRFRQKWGRHPMQGWLDAFEARGLIAHDPVTDTYARTDAA
ncbi:glycosyltransferase family 2 protein [Herbiconiux sp. P18]|uniref:glycosyltransferase family 2 protein n=1 Tax=Herbiconiux liangxiaofengii TaxID=3342795 RepID=UPI0035B92490